MRQSVQSLPGVRRRHSRQRNRLPGVRQLHLLPYHRLGQDKYKALDRPYLMEGILPPEREQMEMLKKIVENTTHLRCRIGG